MTDHRARLLEFLGSLASTARAPAESGRLELDSLALLQVVTYLEQNYRIRLAEHDIEADDLRSVDGIVALIEQFNDATGVPNS
jgi:acyl carrier protein